MLIEHRGHTPSVHDSAYVAPTAVLCGDVVVGPGSRVLHGAVLTAEDGQVRIGRDVVIMENAVIKGRAEHPAVIGDFVLIGPHAHVNGAEVGAGAFIATGASLFPGSVIGKGSEIRINGVVQVNTTVEAGSVVPIGWIAVGTPASVHSPDKHRDIWAVQRDLDFPGTVYGVPRGSSMRVIMASQSEFYGAHVDDVVVGSVASSAPEADPVVAQEPFEGQFVPDDEQVEQVEQVDETVDSGLTDDEHVEHADHLEHGGASSTEGHLEKAEHLEQAEDLEPIERTESFDDLELLETADLAGDEGDHVEDADEAFTPEPDPAR